MTNSVQPYRQVTVVKYMAFVTIYHITGTIVAVAVLKTVLMKGRITVIYQYIVWVVTRNYLFFYQHRCAREMGVVCTDIFSFPDSSVLISFSVLPVLKLKFQERKYLLSV